MNSMKGGGVLDPLHFDFNGQILPVAYMHTSLPVPNL
jgi:hypothetical protein